MREDKLKALQAHIVQLHDSVRALRELYPEKVFTLDGRLVGDIGEVIVAELFQIVLHDGVKKHYDAVASYDSTMQIQIKATFKKSLTYNHEPEYYIGIKLDESGHFEVIYNGPGKYIEEAFRHRKHLKSCCPFRSKN